MQIRNILQALLVVYFNLAVSEPAPRRGRSSRGRLPTVIWAALLV